MQIKDEAAFTWPSKLKGDPSKRSRDKYYHFHRDRSRHVWMLQLEAADRSLYQI